MLAAGASGAPEPAGAPSPLAPALKATAEGRLHDALDIINRLAAGGYRTPDLFDLRGQVDLALGDDDNAERDWRRAASLDPANVSSRLALGQLYARRALWPEAIAAYREVLLAAPRNVEAILGLVTALQRNGQTVSARKLLETSAKVIDDRRLQERWAQVAAESGRPQEAERALTQLAERLQGPARLTPLKKLATLYTSQGRTAEAFAASQQALKIEAAAGRLTAEVYDLAMQPADRLAQQALAAVAKSVKDLDEGTTTREVTFEETQKATTQVAQLAAFVNGIEPPLDRRVVHAARSYAYSLANEAAVNALSYVDLGLADRRDAFASARDAARNEMGRLTKSASPEGEDQDLEDRG